MMAVYRTRILDSAPREIERLDKPIGRRIAERINWLAKNLDNLEPEMLRGELSGLYKLRVGAYRILYEILSEDPVIVIHKIGHRRDVYRVR